MYFCTRANGRRTHDAKDWRIKKWPLRRAAKFREETPRKGGGFATEIAIPRCNNMPEEELVRKEHWATNLDKTPQKGWKNMTVLPENSPIAALFGNCALQYSALTADCHKTPAKAPLTQKAPAP